MATEEVKGAGLADDKHIEDVACEKHTSSDNERIEATAGVGEIDETESRRILSKVDYRLVSILSLLYLVAFIDRSNSK